MRGRKEFLIGNPCWGRKLKNMLCRMACYKLIIVNPFRGRKNIP